LVSTARFAGADCCYNPLFRPWCGGGFIVWGRFFGAVFQPDDDQPGKPLCYGFVTFADPESKRLALEAGVLKARPSADRAQAGYKIRIGDVEVSKRDRERAKGGRISKEEVRSIGFLTLEGGSLSLSRSLFSRSRRSHPRTPPSWLHAAQRSALAAGFFKPPMSHFIYFLRRVPVAHPQQLASSYFGPAEAERLRGYIFLAGNSGKEPFSPTVRLGDSVLQVPVARNHCLAESNTPGMQNTFSCLRRFGPRSRGSAGCGGAEYARTTAAASSNTPVRAACMDESCMDESWGY